MGPRIAQHGRELVYSYLALRKCVGVVAMRLPFALLMANGDDLDSVSQGYYTSGIPLFVAGVGTIGVFLLFYRGFDRRDRIASLIAGGAALVVGLVPCGCRKQQEPLIPLWGWDSSYSLSIWPAVHLLAAAVLFVVLALFCLWLFPLSDQPPHTNPKKHQRNLVYRLCGLVIAGCLVALAVHFAFVSWLGQGGVFWVETGMLLAFGCSWAVKGQAISFLNDHGASPSSSAARPHLT